jgi:hypothetical protein
MKLQNRRIDTSDGSEGYRGLERENNNRRKPTLLHVCMVLENSGQSYNMDGRHGRK